MFLFNFSNEAVKLISAYVQLARKRMIQAIVDGGFDKQVLDNFLSDIEDDIKIR